MKKPLLLIGLLLGTGLAVGQNINDNKVSFDYIQLPLIKIDDAFKKYELRIEHSYKAANEDSLQRFELQRTVAMQQFEIANARYHRQRDSLQYLYLLQLANWEKQVNAGTTTADGKPLPKPNPPFLPDPPVYPNLKAPYFHSDYSDNAIKNEVKIEGFEEGLGGSILTVDLLPIRDIRIVEKKTGSGTSTKYQYSCRYVLPVHVKLATPTDGVLMDIVLFEQTRTYDMKDYKSQYEHQLYMLQYRDQFYAELERHARQKSIREANDYINDQVGYVRRTRHTEIYSVKKFKHYEYSDVTNAYSATVQALSLVGKDRNCSGAQASLEKALKQWNEIMMESNTYDNNARINDKISAMIQCNIAEIQLWMAKFNEADATLNLVLNSGVFKGKSHAKDMQHFYEDRAKRWAVHY